MLKTIIARFTERRALNAYTVGDYAKAEQLFSALRAREGETQRVLRNLGLIRMAQGDLAAAEAYFAREVEAFGPTPDRLQALADVAYLSGDRAKAAQRLREALKDPGCTARELLQQRAAICADPEAHARAMRGKQEFAQANALLAAKEVDEALTLFRRALDADPTDFIALNNIGGILLNQKDDPAGAAKAFSQALAMQQLPVLKINLDRAKARLKEKAS
ncbi:MAG: tetratricopeptide repeat protein [Proteobacteria bacterium]|nr:tetratricopeptide repeat protein [Pseudomonadota bacterium]